MATTGEESSRLVAKQLHKKERRKKISIDNNEAGLISFANGPPNAPCSPRSRVRSECHIFNTDVMQVKIYGGAVSAFAMNCVLIGIR